MANVNVSWVLPTRREKGGALSVDQIKAVRIEISADGGQNWGAGQDFPPTQLSYIQTELEPGTWGFRGKVIDTKDRESAYLTASIEVLDESPPGALLELNLALGA